jgi:hypothetical protein
MPLHHKQFQHFRQMFHLFQNCFDRRHRLLR